jgi:hypothetical protein
MFAIEQEVIPVDPSAFEDRHRSLFVYLGCDATASVVLVLRRGFPGLSLLLRVLRA